MKMKLNILSLIIISFVTNAQTFDFHVNCTIICRQVESVYSEADVDCNQKCRTKTCIDGCSDWEKSGESSCQDICHQSSSWHGNDDDNVGCALGCVIATQTYINQVKDYIGELEAPQLVGGTITTTQVGLRWKGNGEVSGMRYLIQLRQGTGSGEWYYYQPKRRLQQTEITIQNLKPYTKYQFRVAWIIIPNQPPLFSHLSPWISTLPSGPPQSSPRNVRAIPLDGSRIEVTWDRPFYPGGNLIFYTIYLQQEKGTNAVRKDVSVSDINRFVVTGLTANTSYEVRVTATNQRGEGPPAKLRATTYPAASAVEDTRGYLLVTSGSGLLKLGLDIMEKSQFLFNTSSGLDITGLAVHIPLKLVYVSDAEGSIYQIHLITNSQRILLRREQLGGLPVGLSVDWLFGRLFIVLQTRPEDLGGDWQIWQCDLMGKGLSLEVAGLPYLPKDVKADPYNGYLWWVSSTVESGLHRLLLKGSVDSETNPSSKVVFRNKNLGGFALDPPNFQVLVADQTNNTMLSVSLDGTSVMDLRNNTQQAFFSHVSSIAFLNGKFYWTNSKEVFTEELNENTFYHNSYALLGRGAFGNLVAVHRLGQQVPVPLNPPTKVQAIFTTGTVTVTWEPPKTPALMGEGAWEEWRYEAQIQEGQKVMHKADITPTRLTLSGLNPATTYNIKVRAYSKSGKGPWSNTYRGRTLSFFDERARLLWMTQNEFLVTGLNGGNASVLTLQEKLKGGVTHITFFRDTLIISTNGSCFSVDMTTGSMTKIPGMDGIRSTAIDWATNRLFAIHPLNNTIIWRSLTRGHSGILGLMTPALELKVDSFRGHLYWRTQYGVFSSTLTGKNMTLLHDEDIFSERFIYGLAVDSNKSQLWWVVKSKDGCHLYGKTIGKSNTEPLQVRLLPHTIREGSLYIVNERMIWVSEHGALIMYDSYLESAAFIKSENLMVRLVAVKINTPITEGNESFGLLPKAIEASSVKVVGTWNDFGIIWAPLKTTTIEILQSQLAYKPSYPFSGDLQYKVTIFSADEKAVYVTKENSVMSPWSVDPYTPLTVSIRGMTNWAEGESVVVTLRTPPSLPTEPTNVRAFHSSGKDGSVDLLIRWNSPTKPNGHIQNYHIRRCLTYAADCFTYSIDGDKLETKYSVTSKEDTLATFEIWASTIAGEGPKNFLEVRLPPRIFKTVPKILMATSTSIFTIDADNGFLHYVVPNTSLTTIQSVAVHPQGDDLFWMDAQSDIFHSSLMEGKINQTRISRINHNGRLLDYDWIARIIYWVEELPNGTKRISRFDTATKTTQNVLDFPRVNQSPLKLMVSPATGTIYFVDGTQNVISLRVFSSDSENDYDLFDDIEQNVRSNCSCPKSPSLASGVALDVSTLGSPILYVTLKERSFEGHPPSSVMKVDPLKCSCSTLIRLSNLGHNTCDLLAVDVSYLYCYEESSETLLWMTKEGVGTEDDVHKIKLNFRPISLLPLSENTQPMPDSSCLVISKNLAKLSLISSKVTSLTFRVPPPPAPAPECSLSSLPPWVTVIFFDQISAQSNSSCWTSIASCRSVKSRNSSITVDGLSPFTKYVVRVAYETRYNHEYNLPLEPGPVTVFKTHAEAPPGANIVTATAISPVEVRVSFEGPSETPFEVHWRSHTFAGGFTNITNSEKGKRKFSTILDHLSPNTRYEIWVRLYSKNDRHVFTDSPKVTSITFPNPFEVTLVRRKSRSLKVEWVSPTTGNILRHALQYQEDRAEMWNGSSVEETKPGQKYIYELKKLLPGTAYNFRLILFYDTSDFRAFVWPTNSKFQFTTSGGIPSVPKVIRFQKWEEIHVKEGWVVWWEESLPNGSPILAYELQVAQQEDSEKNHHDNLTFTTVYNDTENSWTTNVNDLDSSFTYVFRVRAMNELGVSDWRTQEMQVPEVGPTKLDTIHLPTILGATIPSCIIFFILLLSCLTISIRRSENKRRKVKNFSSSSQPSSRGREVELSSLPPHISHNNNFASEENILYNMQSFPGDDIDLPHISRHNITLKKFLGSGAFGEVHEGTAAGLPGRQGITKIAVKTLRKGSTEREKLAFLKEAQLMSHFQHDHILRLLAVCTDNDHFFLILELMEGGDLLSYLRANRGIESSFTMMDLLTMCLDVAKGCVYLEDMHFVHRDLAARNCLVSSANPLQRIVKIGDFGLARDIYKSDYYRNKGDGLMPVRWMSPESLIDGVFTTQSDVWAFGVILWEILTLGQQPYPARTNLQVLDYVRSGGKPSRPHNCPEDLHDLTLRCWNYSPDGRPTFKDCLRVLLDLRKTISSLPALAVHNVNYITSNGHSGLDNLAYAIERDENHNRNTDPVPATDDISFQIAEGDSTSGASTVPLTVPLRQQYIHLVNDLSLPQNSGTINSMASVEHATDTYETPIKILNKDFSRLFHGEGFNDNHQTLQTFPTHTPEYLDTVSPGSMIQVPPRSIESENEMFGAAVHEFSAAYTPIDDVTRVAPSTSQRRRMDVYTNSASPTDIRPHDHILPYPGIAHRDILSAGASSVSSFTRERQNSLPNFGSSRRHRTFLSSLPCSPLSPSATEGLISPTTASPLSVTFTFPTPQFEDSTLLDHYLRPINNRSFEVHSEEDLSPDQDGSLDDFSVKVSEIHDEGAIPDSGFSESPSSDNHAPSSECSGYSSSYVSMCGSRTECKTGSLPSRGFVNESFSNECQSMDESSYVQTNNKKEMAVDLSISTDSDMSSSLTIEQDLTQSEC